MANLLIVTTLVNLLALAASVWLGFYIITRSPHSRLSWMSVLTLWSLSSFFLHNALAINLPGSGVLPWLKQTVIIILPLWFHLTLLLLPERTRSSPPNILGLILAYGTAGILIAIGVFISGLLSDSNVKPAVFTSARSAGPFL